MKRLVIAVLMIAMVSFCVGAQSKTTLNVLYYIDATQAGYDIDLGIWNKFSKDNPDITVVREELFNEPFHQKMQAYIASGNLPDVFYMWPSGRSMMIHENKLAKDLTVLLGKSYLSNFVPAAIDPKNQGGNYIAEIPQSFTYTTMVLVNKKLLAENGFDLPKTYADLKKMVPKLKAKGIQVVSLPNKDLWPMQSCLFSTVSGRLMGDKFIDDVKAGKAKFTDQGFVDALGFIDTMYKDGVIAREGNQVGYGEGPGMFASGKAAIFIDGDWRVGAFLTDKASGIALIPPKAQSEDFVITNFPAIPGEKNPGLVSAIAGVGYGISSSIPAGSAKEAAAVRLIKYLYSPEVQKLRLEQGAYIPTLKGVTSDKVEPLTTKLAAYYGTIPVTGYVLDGVLDPSVYNVLNNGLQAIGLGTATPAQVAADMQKAMDTWRASK